MANRRIAASQHGAEQKKITDFKNKVRGSKNSYNALSIARSGLTPADAYRIVNWLPAISDGGRTFFSGAAPKTVRDLRPLRPLAEVGPDLEIAWAAAILGRSAETLISFRELCSNLERSLCSNDYARAFAEIERAEQTFGISMWSIELRIALLQLVRGLSDQKAYADSIRSARGRIDVVSFAAFYLSYRNEDSTTSYRFHELMNSMYKAWSEPDGLDHYLKFHLNKSVPGLLRDKCTVLRLEAVSALVDYYETFVTIGVETIVGGTDGPNLPFLEAFSYLGDRINDHRIAKALFFAGRREHVNDQWETNIAPSVAFVLGQPENALISAIDSIHYENWLVEAESRILLNRVERPKNTASLREMAIAAMISVITHDEDFNASMAKLLKWGLNFRSMGFAAGLEDLVWREFWQHPASVRPSAINQFIASSTVYPNSARLFNNREIRARYLKDVTKLYGASPLVALATIEAALDEEIEGASRAEPFGNDRPAFEAAVEAKLAAAIERREFSSALALAAQDPYANNESLMYRWRSIRYQAYCMYPSGEGRLAE